MNLNPENKWIDWKDAEKEDFVRYKNRVEVIFKPVYRELAREVIDNYKITNGVCIDIGAGTGGFGIEIAKISDLKVYTVDIKEEMIALIKEKIKKEGLLENVIPKLGDVHNLPFDDNFADLIVSRGSFHFWRDKKRAFLEIYRVLKKGGIGFIGGGFGKNKKIRERAMALQEKSFREATGGGFHETLKIRYAEIKEILKEEQDFNIIFDESGLWVEIKKT